MIHLLGIECIVDLQNANAMSSNRRKYAKLPINFMLFTEKYPPAMRIVERRNNWNYNITSTMTTSGVDISNMYLKSQSNKIINKRTIIHMVGKEWERAKNLNP